MSNFKIYSDGGARGNPGPAAYGFIVYKDDIEIYSGKDFLGIATNNIAEYKGLLAAMDWVLENISDDIEKINFFLDSELVVKQMKGEYKIKNKELFDIAQKIKNIERKLSSKITYTHVPRVENKQADLLVNQMLDSHTS